MWKTVSDSIVLVIENRDTYREPDMTHRRAVVYFPGVNAFVVVDEAIGPATGLIEVRFHPESPNVTMNASRFVARATGGAKSAGLLVQGVRSRRVRMSLEEAHRSPAMGKQVPRRAVTFAQNKSSSEAVRFVTIVTPYTGTTAPALLASVEGSPGADHVVLRLYRSLRAQHGFNGSAAPLRHSWSLVDEVDYRLDPEAFEMVPPPVEFRESVEKRYARSYDNFRRSQLPLRICNDGVCTPRLSLRGSEEHLNNLRQSLVYVPTKNFLYCGIPKCGVSRWRRLIRRVSGIVTWQDNLAHNPAKNGLQYIADIAKQSTQEAEALLNDPRVYTFVIVRSPYTRLLSGWLDKRGFPQFKLPQTFPAFVYWAVRQTDDQINEHFKPMTSFCGMTEGLRFDAVYRIEEIGTWGPQLVRKLNITDSTATGWGGSFFRSKNQVHNHFSDQRLTEYYTDELMRVVAERYRKDFEVLGYDPNVLE